MITVFDASFALHRAMNVCKSNVIKNIKQNNLNEEQSEKFIDENLNYSELASVFFSILPAKLQEFESTRVYMLWDLGHCQYRLKINPTYKMQRKLKEKTYADKVGEAAYNKARNFLHTNLYRIGICSLLIPGVEADDLAYYFSNTYEKGVLVSDDKDWFLNLNENWVLCQPMKVHLDETGKQVKKATYKFTWNDFHGLMNHLVDTPQNPREIYLLQKSLEGDKDEIPKLTGQVTARRLSLYLSGASDFDKLKPKDKTYFDNQLNFLLKDKLQINLQLADTNWLVKDPTIFDVKKLIEKTNAQVEVGNYFNFLDFAAETNSLKYLSTWKIISKRLNYKE